MFFFAGVGAFYGKPKADLFRGSIGLDNRYFFWSDGTLRDQPEKSGNGNIIEKDGDYETDLTKWSTEPGQVKGSEDVSTRKYHSINIALPMGI